MAGKTLIVDLADLDLNRIVAGIDDIRKYNPQRFEMEQLTAIVYEDTERNICAGYKDVTDQEFWVRGHMPGMPLMPGVVMLEASAQMCSFFVQKHNLLGSKMVGFGGLEDVRFRDPVRPGDRLIVMCQLTKVRVGRMIVCRFQGVVRDSLVVEGELKGIPLPVDALASSGQRSAVSSQRSAVSGQLSAGMAVKDFRTLKVWEKAHRLTLRIYQVTRRFPSDELYGLTSQLRRGTASIPANIAEGCGRGSDADLARFLQISMGSASEVEYHILLARDLGYIDDNESTELHQLVAEVKKMLAAFIQTLKADR